MMILYHAVVYLRLQNILKPSWFYHILFPSCREASYIMRLFIFASKHLKAFLMLLYLCPSWKNIPKISQCLFNFVIFVFKLEKYPKNIPMPFLFCHILFPSREAHDGKQLALHSIVVLLNYNSVQLPTKYPFSKL